jgi:class 3 adenylate cyclase
MHHVSAEVTVSGAPAEKPQPVTVRMEGGKIVPETVTVAPGKIVFTLENRTAARSSMMILNFPPGFTKSRLVFAPFLSGKKLLSIQTFRDIFSSEVIQGTEGIGVRDITILFTDLKGSTLLYERIGDLKAFSLVRQHFDRLGRVINENSGAFVKTIGDAVMASFLNPVDAVKAALEMNKEIAHFNRSFTSRDVILKIGIHKGPCIAVTLNDRLDYFGRSVNIASGVQGLAGAEEVYVTEAVFTFNGVKALLGGRRVFAGKVKLKGIREEMLVYKIATAAASAAPPAPKASAGGAAGKPAP